MKAQLIAPLKDEFFFVVAITVVILVAQGCLWVDALAPTFVGSIIALGGQYLFRDNVHYLLGKAPGKEYLERVELAARSVEGICASMD